MLVLTNETLLFVVFTAIVWYEFFFSMSALEWIITLRVLTLLGGIGVLLFLSVSTDEVEEHPCPICTSETEDLLGAEEPPASPTEESDEFADLLEPKTKQIPTPK
jgi:hypothetical protein